LPERLLRGDFIQPLDLAEFLIAAVLLGLPLAEFLQNANFAVGLDKRLAAALDLGSYRLPLLDKVLLLCPRHQFIALGLDQPFDVDGPGGSVRPAEVPQGVEFAIQAFELLSEHIVNAIGLGQRGATFIAPGLAQAKQGRQSKGEPGHR
jgi:hypothetical protein